MTLIHISAMLVEKEKGESELFGKTCCINEQLAGLVLILERVRKLIGAHVVWIYILVLEQFDELV